MAELPSPLRTVLTEDEVAHLRAWAEAYADARVAEAVAEEQKRVIQIIEAYRVPVGNSAAGEMACDWTLQALHDIRAAIRGAA